MSPTHHTPSLLASALLVASAVTLTGAANGPVDAATSDHDVVLVDGTYEPGHVIVRYDDYLDRTAARSITTALDATVPDFTSTPIGTRNSHLRLLTFDPTIDVANVINELNDVPGINHVAQNQYRRPLVTPDDPNFGNSGMWGLKSDPGADAVTAWNNGYTGSSDVIVAVLDSGTQVAHPDLAANIWSNPGEIAGNSIDDDGNGYVDDVHGWDFLYNNASVYDAPDEDFHGTHVSGTIGAVGNNNTGVVGVNWDVTILPVKFLGNANSTLAMELSALDYILDMHDAGHNIVAVNNSWGCSGNDCASTLELEKIDEFGARGILFVVAAGNSGMDNDVEPDYPSSYVCDGGGNRDWDCIISVTAHNSAGTRPDWSGDNGLFYEAGGPHVGSNVDISAPGVAIYSTYPPNTYASLSGTSMATPHVTGAIALCAAANPDIDARAIRAAVLGTTTDDAALAALIDSGGMLDVNDLVNRCAATPTTPAGIPTLSVNETITNGHMSAVVDTTAVTGGNVIEVQVAERNSGNCGDTIRWRYEMVQATQTTVDIALLETRRAYCLRARVHDVASAMVTDWSEQIIWTTRPGYECTAVNYDASLMATGRTGTDLVLDDDDVSSAISITTEFFGSGSTTRSMRIFSNGYVSLGEPGNTALATGSYLHNLPYKGDIWPSGVVAPWFADFDPSAGGAVRYLADFSGSTIVTWDDVPLYSNQPGPISNRDVSVQAIIERATGTITFQYEDVTYSEGNVASIGITSPDNTGYASISQPGSIADQTAITCTWTDPTETAIVLTDVSAHGAVSGLTGVGDCTTNCATFIDIGDTVTLTATPDTGYTFVGWTGGCIGTEPTCTLSPSTNTLVTANFSATEHALAVSVAGGGSVVASGAIDCPGDCSETVTYGTEVTLTATADDGQYFVGWGGACADVLSVSCTVTVTDDVAVVATFAELVTVSVVRAGDGTGQVRDEGGEIYCGYVDGSCSATLEPDRSLGFRATAADGSTFVAWSDNCIARVDDTSVCDVILTSDVTVTAWFRTTTTPVSLSAASVAALPELSSLVTSADLESGDAVELVARPGTFDPYERVVVTLYSDPVVLADLTAGADGSLSGSISIPDETPVGNHTLVAYGYASATGVRVALNVASPESFVAVPPARLLDTRSSGVRVGALDGSGEAYTLQVTGGDVPASATAVALNVTVVDGVANDFGGFVTVFPCGTRPDASNLNFVSGQTVPNSVIAPLSADGEVCLYVYGTAHLLVDVSGYFVSGFEPLTPDRLLDTRSTGVRVGALDGSGVARTLQVTGGDVPASATAVALNVTVVDGVANDFGGFVTVFPCGTRPDASNLNFVSGQTVPNSVIAPLSADGAVCLYVYGTAHLLVDVSGFFTSGFTPQVPDRLLDTRSGDRVGALDGTGEAYTLQVTGGDVPASATAVALNVTVVDGVANDFGGFVTVFPCDVARPDASNLNFVSGQTVPNSVIAPLSASGTVCLYVYGTAHLLVDVSGHL